VEESGKVSMIGPGTLVPWISSTKPVAIPGDVDVTVPTTLTVAPCVIFTAAPPFSVKVVVVGWNPVAEVQPVTRFATFNEPSPVAKSYPAVVLKAGVVPPVVVVMIP
jgi:hypothetical protein